MAQSFKTELLSPDNADFDRLYTERELAEIIAHSVSAVQKMRMRDSQDGVPFVRVNSSIRYRASDIRRWLASRTTFRRAEEAIAA